MRSTLFMLLTTLALAMAAPAPAPAPLASTSSSQAAPSPAATPSSSKPTTCPKESSKQCCMSINQTGERITEPLTQILPVGGVELSSLVGLSCVPMSADTKDDTCLEDIMCCSSGSVDGFGIIKGCQTIQEANQAKHSLELSSA
ncbi:hypothetical protein ASPZODRAFT_129266 [Penicilliopsis zonata CBS 506.65]|uniref:Hydrophobin n=1 Tax=Penicilliopsis zonata CBS 506.65 TaxID=1073090 RepID=A0A1L9SPE7_9EURO|nr:hypothetical protein ASPZODRAFT_129266 [Penicilliopsis zonata CBS 506.65]OJJ48934.1 hypothetical protein ASPZODRAFT_129266 [Penicilliopsis zonata CBS 506.65]